jgi:hypothetical protein
VSPGVSAGDANCAISRRRDLALGLLFSSSMKKQTKKLSLSRTTLSRLDLERAAGGTGTIGCASLADRCPSMDIPCDPVQTRAPCYTEGCNAGAYTTRPRFPIKR